MTTKPLNRIRVVLAEKDRTNKWLAQQLDITPGIEPDGKYWKTKAPLD